MVALDPGVAAEPASFPADRTAARARRWMLALLVGLALSVVAGIALGAVYVPFDSVVKVLGHHLFLTPGEQTWSAPRDAIIWDVRLPRVLLAALVGAGLAVSGMALQAMVRNLLADPYLLGVSSGASAGAAAAILFGITLGLGEHVLSGSAFVGALAASVLVYAVARSAGRVTSTRLLLAGVAVGYALQAVTSFLIFASDSAEGARSVMFWLLGSLALAGWGQPLAVAVVVVLLTVAVLTVLGRQLDALAVGDETALALGVPPERLRTALLVLVSLCIAVVVSAAGSVGFVGLVVPHLARRAVGAAHVRAVPVAALMGAILLIWADIVARVLLAPQEIPIGIITAVVGAPFLLVLVRRLQATAA
ncbi:FecCD family ABC transporter permease [Pimelobacter simplex]|uniref:ABC transporter (Iron.B12.siderophore.hemin), permease component n=1 Tax=Nocardioides simplex TaxID=2045 RepID=A0A0C5XAG5_NOCSI|nr:iron ABC transporter permease [Pimelobacter simplex]AJR18260.1 ABC transporter (iron.B12.siderophore.hemin), permease component [Pimelobacter simplex]GEB12653.1 ABC transporter permease [Pimelobacter simplex]SFM56306.1 iron complex transport system permease protein [Pimelobacter simplex]